MEERVVDGGDEDEDGRVVVSLVADVTEEVLVKDVSEVVVDEAVVVAVVTIETLDLCQ